VTAAPAVSVAFFDAARQIYGQARAGTTLLFEGKKSVALSEGPSLEPHGEGLRAELAGRFALELEPLSPEATLGGVVARMCRVRGELGGAEIDCLGTVCETRVVPSWDELDALRTISVLIDDQHGVLALARRPRGALGHGQELTVAWLIDGGELLSVEEARISTVYDGEGRQRSAGLELWLPGEDFPRRASGTVVAGSSLELEGVVVHAAVFAWRVEEREGIGQYDVMVGAERPAAA
jgi:hypothetical protein